MPLPDALTQALDMSRYAIVVHNLHGTIIYWKVKRLATREMLETFGVASAMQAIQPDEAVDPDTAAAFAEARLGAALDRAKTILDTAEALLARVVVGVSVDGETWEDVKIVPDAEEDRAASKVSVETFLSSPEVLDDIRTAATRDLEEATERVRPFRGGPGSAAA